MILIGRNKCILVKNNIETLFVMFPWWEDYKTAERFSHKSDFFKKMKIWEYGQAHVLRQYVLIKAWQDVKTLIFSL